ncbi:MAG: hypothetical protein V3W37_06385 [Candidatus Binatia bacterium]
MDLKEDMLAPLRDICRCEVFRNEGMKPSGGWHLYCYRQYTILGEHASIAYEWKIKDSSAPRLRMERVLKITEGVFSQWERKHPEAERDG